MAASLGHWPVGEALFDKIKALQGHNKIILGFSRGKDAVGAALGLLPYFDEVIPVYKALLPDAEFVLQSIRYYERHLFKRKIHVVPHNNTFRQWENFVFQTPSTARIFELIPYPRWNDDEVRRHICKLEGLPFTTYTATGVRAADSVTRRTALMRNGPITVSKHTVHAIWDWNKARLIGAMQEASVKLPIDYRVWGRTLDGVDARFMIPMRERLPRDYELACERFPLIPADILRYERIRKEQGHAT